MPFIDPAALPVMLTEGSQRLEEVCPRLDVRSADQLLEFLDDVSRLPQAKHVHLALGCIIELLLQD